MSHWYLSEIVKAVDGKLLNPPKEDPLIQGVFHDTRMIEENSLFVPIIAQRDGHDFIEAAIEQGAGAAFWSRSVEHAPKNLPLIQVKNTQDALRNFSVWYLAKIKPKVVAITGSNGKTTTKDMTASILAQKYKTHKTAGNFNNELGVPLTILSMPKDTEVLVSELGMSEPGEIEYLTNIVHPDIAAITMIGESHIKAFGSRDSLAKEKLSILSGLHPDGLFVFPKGEKLITSKLTENLRTKSFGVNSDADIYSSDIVEKIEETKFLVHTDNDVEKIKLPVPGRYNVQNALLAILIGEELNVSFTDAKIGLEHMELTKNRLEWLDGIKQTRLLNDAYNASPTSIKAALNYFSKIKTDSDKIVVLGDILELGSLSKELHESIADELDLESYKMVILYGKEMKYLFDRLYENKKPNNVIYVPSKRDELINKIEENIAGEELILFKSSNGMDLLSIVDDLKI